MTLQQEFWRDPGRVPEGIGKITSEFQLQCHPAYYTRMFEVSDYLANVLKFFVRPPATVLELGCGVGRNLHVLAQDGYIVSGIEINPECREIASAQFPYAYPAMQIGAVEELLPDAEPVDVILTQGFLMHVPYEHDSIFEHMRRVAQKVILTNEAEQARMPPTLKFPRSLAQVIPTPFWKQTASIFYPNVEHIKTSITRVFIRTH
jgi:SAM-dependent methyltransferase